MRITQNEYSLYALPWLTDAPHWGDIKTSTSSKKESAQSAQSVVAYFDTLDGKYFLGNCISNAPNKATNTQRNACNRK